MLNIMSNSVDASSNILLANYQIILVFFISLATLIFSIWSHFDNKNTQRSRDFELNLQEKKRDIIKLAIDVFNYSRNHSTIYSNLSLLKLTNDPDLNETELVLKHKSLESEKKLHIMFSELNANILAYSTDETNNVLYIFHKLTNNKIKDYDVNENPKYMIACLLLLIAYTKKDVTGKLPNFSHLQATLVTITDEKQGDEELVKYMQEIQNKLIKK